jgi:hypothetical protein
MPFELNIAVKRPPVGSPEGQETRSRGATERVTAVEVTGTLSAENAAQLTRQLDDLEVPRGSCVIVRFVGDVLPPGDDPEPLEELAAWMKRRRADGYNVYLDVAEARAREAFMRVDELKTLMLPAGADPTVPRRIIDE